MSLPEQSSVSYRRPSSSLKLWKSEDLRELRQLAQEGVAPADIALRLRRTESAIRNKAGLHGISLRSAAK
ncbi:hypothetical protein [Peristeroidobacter soli]|jgi:hypothetical protein|uniref:hypothetical protein n=1 Tax=Peristeroidobacter soli TaxID=2497877 RepID=UPI00101E1660|nr:hypothetical protein [Peristeroidobacter soli]